ncbi:MAG: thymidine phosphorylase [Anaerolineales bacterium]|nr:thymidine phosphorylase [Anaerolineales bacterium]
MRAIDIIIKKREKKELTEEEIRFFINGFTAGEIPDYQAAAWAMAVLLNGMTPRETKDLTMVMVESGDILDLSEVAPNAVDKHSSGGVGDKTTLVVEPVVAACGLPVGKMSGRGLNFSGGTLDKMESIPGYRCDLNQDEFLNQLQEIGMVLTGQTADLAPADGELYALRDVTGTVDSIPLIASSIMSKKIAAGAHAIVLDVKIGLGAFMESLDLARELGELMVNIADLAGRKAVALLSDMNQPLGIAVGNALEVKEAIDTLHGNGPQSFWEHCQEVAAHMLIAGGKANDAEEGRELVEKAVQGGQAWERFLDLVSAQEGDVSYLKDPQKLPQAALIKTVNAPRSGFIKQIHARRVGETAVLLGAGREEKGESIDHGVGIEILREVGDRVEEGEPLLNIHAKDEGDFQAAEKALLEAHSWSETPVDPLPQIYEVIH